MKKLITLFLPILLFSCSKAKQKVTIGNKSGMEIKEMGLVFNLEPSFYGYDNEPIFSGDFQNIVEVDVDNNGIDDLSFIVEGSRPPSDQYIFSIPVLNFRISSSNPNIFLASDYNANIYYDSIIEYIDGFAPKKNKYFVLSCEHADSIHFNRMKPILLSNGDVIDDNLNWSNDDTLDIFWRNYDYLSPNEYGFEGSYRKFYGVKGDFNCLNSVSLVNHYIPFAFNHADEYHKGWIELYRENNQIVIKRIAYDQH